MCTLKTDTLSQCAFAVHGIGTTLHIWNTHSHNSNCDGIYNDSRKFLFLSFSSLPLTKTYIEGKKTAHLARLFLFREMKKKISTDTGTHPLAFSFISLEIFFVSVFALFTDYDDCFHLCYFIFVLSDVCVKCAPFCTFFFEQLFNQIVRYHNVFIFV